MQKQTLVLALLTFALSSPSLLGAEPLNASTGPAISEEGPTVEAPSTTSANDLADQEAVAENPVPDTSDVVEAQREESYSDSSLDHTVSHALFEQGYFSGDNESSKEDFITALKNFQTLNGMDPTGEITPAVVEKLGVGQDQFSPE